jgi:carboxymethylenebutenolidase
MTWKARTGLVALIAAVTGAAVHRLDVVRLHAATPISTVHSILPSAADSKRILNTTPRHREWVSVPVSTGTTLSWITFPDRSDKAPVILLTSDEGGPSDWMRAVSDQLAAEGFITMAPAAPAGTPDASAVHAYATTIPAGDGQVLTLAVDKTRTHVDANGSKVKSSRLALTVSSWPRVVSFLNKMTGNNPTKAVSSMDDHAAHFTALMAQAGGSSTPASGIQPAAQKRRDLPASILTAADTIAHTKLRHEWVDIPTATVKLHTWVSYPAGNSKAGIVLIMQQAPGNDIWEKGIADQLAQEGFIAVAPDLHSGLGPHGGGFDDFEFRDDVMRANAQLNDNIRQSLYHAAYEWALKLPRSSGKVASLGFCAGGGNSFRFAGEVPELKGAVVFYGGAPDEATMAKINAPVIGFYGDNDVRLTASVEPTTATMKKLGKSYESHIYKDATHAFIWYQDIGRNYEAMADSWPRAIAFLKKHLN